MDEPLRLEYACTPAELEEAQSIVMTQQVGGGSKWLTAVILLLTLAGVLFALYVQVAPEYRPYVFGFLLVACAIAILGQRRNRRKRSAPMTVELTDRDLRVTCRGNHATVRWSAFRELVESETLFVLVDRTSALLYVFPKRVFPDEGSCDWFRSVAGAAAPQPEETPDDRPTVPASASEAGSVTLEVRLRYRDYLDRAIASWLTRGIMVFMGGLMLGAFVVAARQPMPNAVYSIEQVFLFFMVPLLVVFETMIVFVAATHAWLGHRRSLVRQTVTLTELGLSHTSVDGQTTTGWQTPTRYKETPWSFIVWWPGTQMWLLLPKRAFSTSDDVIRCREILATHAKRSAWYFS
ncbi:MAG: YcxB family protein [Planctomycetota bacterium]|jgi:hypothetical protein